MNAELVMNIQEFQSELWLKEKENKISDNRERKLNMIPDHKDFNFTMY